MRKRAAMTEAEEARLCASYVDGLPLSTLQERFRLGPESIKKILLRRGVELRPKGKRVREP